MIPIAVFASGNGSNFEAIVKNAKGYTVAILICDQLEAKAWRRAKRLGIPFQVVDASDYPSKAAYEAEIIRLLALFQVRWIALAGYMRICGKTLLDKYPNHIINIHPALLPAFSGIDAIGQALKAGVKVTGVTIHIIDEGIDTGTIIAQEAYRIPPGANRDRVQAGIQRIEHRLYPQVIAELIKEES
ncbi:MAG: phosphoribosylglycinamide formyltransferase [Candidatus Izemoplasmatales bacterium]|jgi:phosphoribosylglycinamide formyltransferase-1